MSRKKTHEEYEKEIMELDLALFPVDRYVNAITPILHECWEGHTWMAKPSNILFVGTRCPHCCGTKRKTSESYQLELDSKSIPIKLVDTYKNANRPAAHSCNKCGNTWNARPTDILRGKGCPACAKTGFDKNKPALLYFVKFEYNNHLYYKVGITNRTTTDRLKSDWNTLSMKSLWEFEFSSGDNASKAEARILEAYSFFKTNTGALKSGGNTETLSVSMSKEEAFILIGDLL